MRCRFCKAEVEDTLIDLGHSPAANSFLVASQLDEPESFYPLRISICRNCFLVQIDEYKKSTAIFNDSYVYFSSYSKSWLEHAQRYTETMVARFGYGGASNVVEIASNDGYLLQYFKEKQIPVLGIEPTANTAEVARSKGIESITEFFGVKLASRLAAENRKADLLIGNNVLAHVPDIVDFVAGMKILLKSDGVITMEFPHLMQLVDNCQFDTIYHEHFSYLSFYTVQQIFASQGLELFDVEELLTHGGSLRIYAKHGDDASRAVSPSVNQLLEKELQKGINTLEYYKFFRVNALRVKMELLSFLLHSKFEGKKVAGYGAAAKGNTLLNYCGIKDDLISYVVDANPHKQNKWLPGSHIPVVNEEHLRKDQPDYLILFPWNLKQELISQLSYIFEWNGKFVIPIPQLEIVGESDNKEKTLTAILNQTKRAAAGIMGLGLLLE